MIVLDTWMILDKVKDQIFRTELDGIMSVASVVACITGGYLILKNARDFIVADSVDLLGLLKPLLVVALVCNFQTLILAPIDAMINIIMGLLAEVFGSDVGSYTVEWKNNLDILIGLGAQTQQEVYDAEMAEMADSNIVVRYLAAGVLSIKKFLLSMVGGVSLTFSALVGGILFIVAKLALFVQQVLSFLFYCLNGIAGPFHLAVTMGSDVGERFKSWLARQMQLAIWVPVGFIIMKLNLAITRAFVEIGQAEGIDLGADWLMMGLQIATLIAIFCVPKIATQFIPGSGTSDVHHSMAAPVKMIAAALGKH